jgi:hypothetical protein
MSDIDQKRARIKDAYPGSGRWADMVARMPDNQVLAIYRRFMAEGKIK